VKLRALIVDDETVARRRIRRLLTAEPDIVVAGECADGASAITAIERERPDLVFLDIQMPELDGFGVLRRIDLGELPSIVFVTAYDRYAVRAFDVHAVDYLLKPFNEERFAEALSRARARLLARDVPVDVGALLADARSRQGPVERVLIREGSQVHVLPIETIDYVEAQDDYVAFKANGKQYLKGQTMAAVEATMDPARFVRIHRSYLLNIERIARVELYAKDSRVAILRDGTRLPVSRAGYARLAKLL
jgi:two-component system, LytTR family, response regulator